MLRKQNLDAAFLSAPPMLSLLSCTPTLIFFSLISFFRSLVDTVYALKDEVKELKQENKRMKQCLEEELKSRKDLEKLVRRLLKQTDECGREDTGRKSSLIA